jgi:hypothetical protein
MNKQDIIKNILTEDLSIYLNHLASDVQLKGVLTDITASKVTIHSLLKTTNISLCDPIIFRIHADNYVYSFTGEVFQIIDNNSIKIKIKRISKNGDKRKSLRYEVSLKAVITEPDTLFSEYAIVKNINLSGICFDCNVILETNRMYIINLMLPKNELCVAEGIITRRKHENNEIASNKYEYGFEIISVNEVNKELLEKYILSLNSL